MPVGAGAGAGEAEAEGEVAAAGLMRGYWTARSRLLVLLFFWIVSR